MLSSYDFKIIHAKNGKEAVDFFENFDFRLVLMDIKMPILDGFSAASEIRKKNSDIPIIALTAYALEKEVNKYSGVFDAYLTKPIDEEKFRSVVTKFSSANQ